MKDTIEAVIASAGVLRRDGIMFKAETLRALHDGRRLFWDEATRQLLYRGPITELESSVRLDPTNPRVIASMGFQATSDGKGE